MNKHLSSNQEPYFLITLRVLIYLIATSLLFYGWVLQAGQLGALLGALLGVLLAYPIFYYRVRKLALFIFIFSSLFLAWSIGSILNSFPFFSRLFGVAISLSLTQFFGFLFFVFAISLFLRTFTLRYPFFAVFEISAISSVVVYRVMEHRDLQISEPRALSDWAWSRGDDPIALLVLLGIFTLCLAALLLLQKERFKKIFLTILFLILVGMTTFLVIQKNPMDPPPQRAPLGLTGDPVNPKEPSEGKNSKEESDQQKSKGEKGKQEGKENPNEQGEGSPKTGNEKSGEEKEAGKGKQGSQEPLEMPFSNSYPKGSSFPVAVVLFHDDYHPAGGYYYFRQTAFSYFNGTRLVRAIQKEMDHDLLEDYPTRKISLPQEKKNDDLFIKVPTTVAMVVNHRHPFGLLNPVYFEPKENPNPSYFRLAYGVDSIAPHVPFEKLMDQKAGNPKWSEAIRKTYSSYPNDSRYENLAKQITSLLPKEIKSSPMAQALILRLWLEKNTIYTRQSEHADKQDPTADFLFGDRRGYCVHLAHSMAFLLRSLGIPSRVAAGYAAPEGRRKNGSSILLQNQDAHAWAELYLEGVGWVVMDVGPERSEEEPTPEVNSNLQRAMGELAREDSSAGKSEESKPEKSGLSIFYGYLLLGLFLLLILALYFIKIWRRIISRLSSSQIHRLSYRATLDRLAEVGLKRNFGETREVFAVRITPQINYFEQMTQMHLAKALGSKSTTVVLEWREMAKKIKKEIKIKFGFWRRLLGLLNPISWIGVK